MISQERRISNPTTRKIKSFRDRKPGWHYGGGVPPTEEIAKKAISISDLAAQLGYASDAFPGIDGEIMVAVYHKPGHLEFTVEVNGRITFAREQDEEEVVYREGCTLNDALKELRKFGKRIWNLSEIFTRTITIQPSNVSQVWHLETHQVPGSPLFPENVSRTSEIPSVSISGSTTQGFHQSLSFSGHLPSMNYQGNVASVPTRAIPEMSAMGTYWGSIIGEQDQS